MSIDLKESNLAYYIGEKKEKKGWLYIYRGNQENNDLENKKSPLALKETSWVIQIFQALSQSL